MTFEHLYNFQYESVPLELVWNVVKFEIKLKIHSAKCAIKFQVEFIIFIQYSLQDLSFALSVHLRTDKF